MLEDSPWDLYKPFVKKTFFQEIKDVSLVDEVPRYIIKNRTKLLTMLGAGSWHPSLR
jgi:hypothetical protein